MTSRVRGGVSLPHPGKPTTKRLEKNPELENFRNFNNFCSKSHFGFNFGVRNFGEADHPPTTKQGFFEGLGGGLHLKILA